MDQPTDEGLNGASPAKREAAADQSGRHVSAWFLAQGVAGVIERCARSSPEIDVRFLFVLRTVGYLVLGTLMAGAFGSVAGILTRSDLIPLFSTALAINCLCVLIALYMAVTFRRFVRLIGSRLSEIPEQLPDRFFRLEMTLARVWNWIGVITCFATGLSTNDAWSTSTQSTRINPNLELFLMPILYSGSAYFFYMAYLIGMTKRYARTRVTRET